MRKLIFILFLLPSVLSAQTNTISIVLQPVDLGIGLRYDKKIDNLGLYVSASYGNYSIDENTGIRNHIKSVIGALKYLPGKFNGHPLGYLSAGVSYSYYGNIQGYFSERTLQPVSMEFGCGVRFKKAMTGFSYDPIKNESTLAFGINF
jgi:hypothetical protein